MSTIVNGPKPKFMTPSGGIEVRELCRDFLKKHPLSAIEFDQYFNDDSGFILHSEPSVINYYISEEIPFTAPAPQELISEKFWYFLSQKGSYQEVFKFFKQSINLGSVLNMVDLFPRQYECFSFGFTLDQERATNYFINHREEFENFTHYFRDKGAHLIAEAESQKISIPTHQLPNFRGLEKNPPEIHQQIVGGGLGLEKIQKGIKNALLEMDHVSQRNNPLPMPISLREFECIRFMLTGLTAKEMGEEMSISKRTVENHLENIKRKLGCRKKSEIIQYFLNFQKTGS